MLTMGYREADDRNAGLMAYSRYGGLATTSIHTNPYPGNIILGREWMALTKRCVCVCPIGRAAVTLDDS